MRAEERSSNRNTPFFFSLLLISITIIPVDFPKETEKYATVPDDRWSSAKNETIFFFFFCRFYGGTEKPVNSIYFPVGFRRKTARDFISIYVSLYDGVKRVIARIRPKRQPPDLAWNGKRPRPFWQLARIAAAAAAAEAKTIFSRSAAGHFLRYRRRRRRRCVLIIAAALSRRITTAPTTSPRPLI